MSTLGRRLDLYVLSGKLEATTEPQLWALLFKMADHALVDKLRILRRLEQTEGQDGAFAQMTLTKLGAAGRGGGIAGEVTVDEVMRTMEDSIDRQILQMWLQGTPHRVTAEQTGLAPHTVRKRWETIRSRLRAIFNAGDR